MNYHPFGGGLRFRCSFAGARSLYFFCLLIFSSTAVKMYAVIDLPSLSAAAFILSLTPLGTLKLICS